MDGLLDGLRLYQPQTFLFPSNYVHALSKQAASSAAVTLGVGLFILVFGLPLRRITASVLTAVAFWVIGGALSMSMHLSFALFAFGLGGLGAFAGLLFPRLSLALVTAILFAVCTRALGISLDVPVAREMPFELFSGAFALFFLIGFVAWFSWIALASALLGATLVVYSIPPLLGGFDPGHVVIGGALAFLAFVGLVLQMRQGVRPRPQWMQPQWMQQRKKKRV